MFFSFCKFSKPSRGGSTEKPSLSCPPPRPHPSCWAISTAAPAFELLLGKTENHSYAAPNRPASCLRNDRGLGPAPKRLGLLRQLRQSFHIQGCARSCEGPKALGGHYLQVSFHWEAQRQGVSWPRSRLGNMEGPGAEAEVPGGGRRELFQVHRWLLSAPAPPLSCLLTYWLSLEVTVTGQTKKPRQRRPGL